jgi:hypothetical protein
MINMFNAIKTVISYFSDHIDNARFARLRRRLPVEFRNLKMKRDSHIIKSMWYDLPNCPDSAGYVSLRGQDDHLYISSLVERDFRRPGLKEIVFVDGKRLPTKTDGRHTERRIPYDAEVMLLDSKEVKVGGRTRWEPRIIRVLPKRELSFRMA